MTHDHQRRQRAAPLRQPRRRRPPDPLRLNPAPPSNAAIAVTKSPIEQTIRRGRAAHWTITVTNTGNVTLTNVTVSDTQAPRCARTSATLPALASMAPNASSSYSCTLGNVSASFTKVAVATGTPPSGHECERERLGARNSQSAAKAATPKPIVRPKPPKPAPPVVVVRPKPPKPKPAPPAVLVVTKVAAERVVRSGHSVAFLIAVRNRGRGPAANVIVCDRPPDGLVFVRARGARFVNGNACWRIERLAATKAKRFAVRVRPVRTNRGKVIVNVATISSTTSCSPRTALAVRRGAVCKARAPIAVLAARVKKKSGVTG